MSALPVFKVQCPDPLGDVLAGLLALFGDDDAVVVPLMLPILRAAKARRHAPSYNGGDR